MNTEEEKGTLNIPSDEERFTAEINRKDEEIQKLKGALKWALSLVNNYADNPSPETISKYKASIKLID